MHDDLEMLSPDHATVLLAEVGRLRSDTRADLQSGMWRWFLLWGLLAAGAALSTLSPWVARWYWLPAVTLGLVGTAYLDVRFCDETGVRRHDWPYFAVGGAIAVLSFAGTAVLPSDVAVVWFWVVFGAGFTAFSLLERNRPAARLLAGMAGLSVVAGVVVDDAMLVYTSLACSFSVALVGIAWQSRR